MTPPVPQRALTAPQRALLAEIVASSTGGLAIIMNMRYGRTALALEERGLVKRQRGVYGSQQFFEPTEAGRAAVATMQAASVSPDQEA